MLRYLLLAVTLALMCRCSTSSRDRNDKPHRVVCYWGSWSFYRWSFAQSMPENMNPNLCTHIMYGFAMLHENNNSIGYMDHDLCCGDTEYKSGIEWGQGMYRRLNHLREVNPHLTTMISIGGWKEGSNKYSKMASNPQSRKQFVNSVIDFLKLYDFDGLDLDWEFPGFKAVKDENRTYLGDPNDKQNFIELVKELRTAFKPHGYVLSAAVSAGKPTVDVSYDVKQLNELLDFISVMSYDFHVGLESKTAHNAPLYPRPDANELNKQFTVQYGIDYWLKLGADPKKVNMGVPLYGRTFTLVSASEHGLGAKAEGAGGDAGLFTQEIGYLSYNEICLKLKTNEWKVFRDNVQKVPYAVKDRQWVGYDDVESIKEKIAFLKSRKIGGAVAWTLNDEDFNGVCGGGKNPLLKTISGELNGITGPEPVIHEVHVTKDPHQTENSQTNPTHLDRTTQPSVVGHFKCEGPGYFADPENKTIFHECIDIGSGKLNDIVLHCPGDTVYDQQIHTCKHQ